MKHHQKIGVDDEGFDWTGFARNLVRAEMMRRGINYVELATRLKVLGITEDPRNLSNKISRGTFSAAFFFQVMKALGARSVDFRWEDFF